MKTLVIKVYCNEEAFKNEKKVFERILNLPESVSFEADALVSSLKFLFGSQWLFHSYICNYYGRVLQF